MSYYANAGVSKLIFIPGASGVAAFATGGVATSAELTAGLDLGPQLKNISGMKVKTAFLEVKVLAYKTTGQVADRKTMEAPVLMLVNDDTSDATRLALVDGVKGFLVWLPLGRVAGKRQEVWRVVSAGANDEKSVDGLAEFEVSFSSDVPPTEGLIPA